MDIDERYKEGKIYELGVYEEPELKYYGSTINTLAVRISKHKSKWKSNAKCKSTLLFETGYNVYITLIKNFPCNNVKELEAEERKYIENNICVNKNIPGRTHKEYYEDNKERIQQTEKIRSKIYRENNKEKEKLRHKIYDDNNKEKRKEKITCDCGSILNKKMIPRHKKTKKHINLMENKNIIE